MATSLFFMSANPSTTNDDMSGPKKVVTGYENASTEPMQRQQRTKRPSNKTQAPNKQRRRGLGVAELERLSIQDRWKKRTEIPKLQVSSTGQFFTDPTDFHIQTSFDLDASHQTPTYGLQGYCMTTKSPPESPFPGTARGFVVSVSRGYAAGQVVESPYGQLVGAPAVLAEASRELTSMPNNVLQQQQQRSIFLDTSFSTCFEKKEISNGRSIAGTGLDRAKSAERRVRSSTRKKMDSTSNHGCRDFLELNLGNYNYGGSAAQSLDAANCCERTGGYDGIRTHSPIPYKEAELMSVRRKVKKNNSSPSSIGGRRSSSLVLEYDFFPGKASRSSLPQELNIPNYSSTSSSSYAPHSSSSIDLSLNLSSNNTNY